MRLSRPWMRASVVLAAWTAVRADLTTAHAQQNGTWISGSAEAVLAITHSDPVPLRGDTTELTVEQSVIMLKARVPGGRWSARATFNLEGWTIPDGVLTVGGWGEGFTDRRHPHTYVHELMLSGTDLLGSIDGDASVSISVGKGFVAFGTDDPMSRPALRYPVNHHLSQVLERAVVIAGVRTGPVAFEGTLFNGDEPERPGQWPRIGGRFGDSWALRVTTWPRDWLEAQGSYARVASPEHRPGAGANQVKWSASLRAERAVGPGALYGLAEWARTSEADGFFTFGTLLLEGAWSTGAQRLHYRFERTDRPEEERQSDPFRSVRPHFETSTLGTSRWNVHTAGYSVVAATLGRRVSFEPLVELSYATVSNVGGGLFDTRSFYGRNTHWSIAVGLRIRGSQNWDMAHRMGRYGVIAPTHMSGPREETH